MADPQTHDEWQAAADSAEALLLLDSARQYGLLTGGPKVNVDRAQEILDAAAKLGITPRPDAAERFVDAWQAHCDRRRQAHPPGVA